MPTEAEEVWRYSRISELDLDSYRPAEPAAAGVVPEPQPLADMLDAVGARSGLAVAVNGRIVRVEVDETAARRGLAVAALSERPDGDDVLGSVMSEPVDMFGDLNTAFLADAIVVDVPDGMVLEHPVVVAHWVDGEGLAVFPRTIVRVGRDAQAVVLEHHGSADVAALSVPITEIDVAAAGRLRYLVVQDLGPRMWQVGYQSSQGGRDCSSQLAAVALGGEYARHRQDARLVGAGGSSELLAVYFGEGSQMHDFRTMQDHVAPNTTSELLFKGAVEDQARGVYSGLIRIRKDAQKTVATQTNRNLVLSEGAHADSVPNLEIEANDVRCSHATAVGPIDEDQRFYVESRGVPPEVAEQLIVVGFFGEVLARLPVPALASRLGDAVASKLQRRAAST
jgi:Fe-S cluster assembly protein SufD